MMSFEDWVFENMALVLVCIVVLIVGLPLGVMGWQIHHYAGAYDYTVTTAIGTVTYDYVEADHGTLHCWREYRSSPKETYGIGEWVSVERTRSERQ